jgi:hypothetical protein
MAKTRMPRDDNSQSIQLLRFRRGGAQTFTVNPSSATVRDVPLGTRVITLVCEVAAYFETSSDETVSATITDSHYIPPGIPYDISLGTDLSDTDNYHRYISIITMGDSGLAHISERE